MKNMLLALAVTTAITAPANAATYIFSFTGDATVS